MELLHLGEPAHRLRLQQALSLSSCKRVGVVEPACVFDDIPGWL